jgi:hypothetical protein
MFPELPATINYSSYQNHPLGSMHRSCENEPQKQMPSHEFHIIRRFFHGNSRQGPRFIIVLAQDLQVWIAPGKE